jgi:hypothetical protein
MTRVFISHATEDRDFVEKEIISLLQRHGIQTWYSTDDIQTAAHWEQTIRLGLESCDWFLVVLTPRSVASTWVRAEVQWGFDERNDRFVPVLAEDCEWRKIHLMMRTIQFVDFRQVRGEAQRRLLKCWNISPVSLERDRMVKRPGGGSLPEDRGFPVDQAEIPGNLIPACRPTAGRAMGASIMGNVLPGILAMVVGLVVFFGMGKIGEIVGQMIYPPPAGLDPSDPALFLAALAKTMPAGAFVAVLAAWALASFAGAWVAARLAPGGHLAFGLAIGALGTLAAIATMLMIPHPIWVWVLGVAEFLPAAYLGAKLATHIGGLD